MEMLSTSIELARRSNALTQLRTITNRTHVRYVHLPIPHVVAEKNVQVYKSGGYSYTPLSYSIKLMKIYMKFKVHPSNLHARPMRRRAAIQTLPTPTGIILVLPVYRLVYGLVSAWLRTVPDLVFKHSLGRRGFAMQTYLKNTA